MRHAQRGQEHPQFAQSQEFSRARTPCVATLRHEFRRMDVDVFESALGRWAQECLGEGEATIAIDGKALRGIHGGELPGMRLVEAYAGEIGMNQWHSHHAWPWHGTPRKGGAGVRVKS